MAKKVNGCPVPKGILVVIGGAEDKELSRDRVQDKEKDPEKKKDGSFISNEVLKGFTGLMRKRKSAG